MTIFGANHTPTWTERIRQAAGWLLVLTFTAGWLFVMCADGTPSNGIEDFMGFAILPVFALIWLLGLRIVVGWLEWRRLVREGEWRTTRASRLAGLLWLLWCVVYVAQLVSRTDRAWSGGDLPKFAVGLGLVAAATIFLSVAAFRTLRVTVEVQVDRQGVYTDEWRGVIGWTAIDTVVSPKTYEAEDELRLIIRPEALPHLPAAVRRQNGYVRISLSKANLSSDGALAVMHAAYPDLKVGGRSAGLVLPVRGATDVVEADL